LSVLAQIHHLITWRLTRYRIFLISTVFTDKTLKFSYIIPVFINAGWATYVVSGILRQIIKIILLIINWWFKKSLDLSFPPILFLVSSINQTYSFLSIILIFLTNFNHSRVNFNNFLNFAQIQQVQKMMVFCTSAQNERCPDRFFWFFLVLCTLHSSNAKIATIRYADRCENRPFSSPRDKKKLIFKVHLQLFDFSHFI
jgi:hypothetical protein